MTDFTIVPFATEGIAKEASEGITESYGIVETHTGGYGHVVSRPYTGRYDTWDDEGLTQSDLDSIQELVEEDDDRLDQRFAASVVRDDPVTDDSGVQVDVSNRNTIFAGPRQLGQLADALRENGADEWEIIEWIGGEDPYDGPQTHEEVVDWLHEEYKPAVAHVSEKPGHEGQAYATVAEESLPDGWTYDDTLFGGYVVREK